MTSTNGSDSYIVDGLQPEKTILVSSVAELSAALTESHAAGAAVIPWGGGTRMHVGNVPERYTTAIDLTGLSNNIEHESGDLTLVADAGVTIAELSKVLAKQGQRLPFDVQFPEKATLGGSVASNAAGQSRSSLGGIRDWVIGMKVVLADGTLTKSGGRVVKNVQGYDLHRLQTGAFGTLGVIIEVALKVVPIPATSTTFAVWFGSVEDAGEYALQVFDGPTLPEALTVFAGRAAISRLTKLDTPGEADASGALVLAAVAGGNAAVTRQENDLTGLAGSTGANGYEVLRGTSPDAVWSPEEQPVPETLVTLRTTLKPRDAVKLLAQNFLNEDSDRNSGELQTGYGTVAISLSNGTRADIDRIRKDAASLGSQSVIERCPLVLKSEIDVFGEQGPSLAVMKSIKQHFDPKRLLNPGRFAGRI